jgi:hypothetical protein
MRQLRMIGGHSATTIECNLRKVLVLDHPRLALPTGAGQPLLHRFRQEVQQLPEGELVSVVDAVKHLLAGKHAFELCGFQARAAAGDRGAVWSYLRLPGRRGAYDPARVFVPWVQNEIFSRVIQGDREAIQHLVKLSQTSIPDRWMLQRRAMVWQGDQWYEKGNSFFRSIADHQETKGIDTLVSHYQEACRVYTPQFLSRAWLSVNGFASAPSVAMTSVLRPPT